MRLCEVWPCTMTDCLGNVGAPTVAASESAPIARPMPSWLSGLEQEGVCAPVRPVQLSPMQFLTWFLQNAANQLLLAAPLPTPPSPLPIRTNHPTS